MSNSTCLSQTKSNRGMEEQKRRADLEDLENLHKMYLHIVLSH